MSTVVHSESSPIRVAVVYVRLIIVLSKLFFLKSWAGIRGGGIAGITLAIALTRLSTTRTTSVHLYEAAPKFTETGAGIGMFRRPWQIMKRLDLGEEIKTVANIPDPEDGLSMHAY